jgi:hypothetical protein
VAQPSSLGSPGGSSHSCADGLLLCESNPHEEYAAIDSEFLILFIHAGSGLHRIVLAVFWIIDWP